MQRRHAELGRIRLGAKRGGNGAPMKLDAFRFTSASQGYIRDLAELYGGTAQAWDNGGKAEWEVYTDATSIPVIAVKGGLTQWMETWSGGGCVHRCDGEQGADGEPCDLDSDVHRNAKPTTRLSLMLPELEAVGVFRMESHGWNAAAEIPAVAELAQYVGDLVPAVLHLVERRSVKDGKTSRFVVPVLDLQIGTARLREIVQAKSGGPVEVAAPATVAQITDGSPEPAADDDYVARAGAVTTPEQARDLWNEARLAKKLTMAVKRAIQQRVVELTGGQTPDVDAVWQQVLAEAGKLDMSSPELDSDFASTHDGLLPASATAEQLAAYLETLRTRALTVQAAS